MGHSRNFSYPAYEMLCVKAILLLINPQIGFQAVLESLGLKFSNSAHAKKFIPIICWCLWYNTTKQMQIWPLFVDQLPPGAHLVGHGQAGTVVNWLGGLLEFMTKPVHGFGGFETFADVLKASNDDFTGLKMHRWLSIRKESLEPPPVDPGLLIVLQDPMYIKFSTVDELKTGILHAMKHITQIHVAALLSNVSAEFQVFLGNSSPKRTASTRQSLQYQFIAYYLFV